VCRNDAGGRWAEDDRGYAEAPVTGRLTGLQVAGRLPGLGIRIGDPRPHARGKIREYLPL
jgi:hypothetical protein